NPRSGIYSVYARRKPGVSLDQAQADVKRVAADIATKAPALHPFYTANVADLTEWTFPTLNPTLLTLFARSGVLLLIAWPAAATAGSLLRSRSVFRAGEEAFRVGRGAP